MLHSGVNPCVVVGSEARTRYQWWNECDNMKGYTIKFSVCVMHPLPARHTMVVCRVLTSQLLTRTHVLNSFLV